MLSYQNMYVSLENGVFEAFAAGSFFTLVVVGISLILNLSCENKPRTNIRQAFPINYCMYIQRLQLINFKNYAEVETDFSPRINVLVGKNGSGKTNLLDAIYYLSFTKSAFSVTDQYCIRLNEPFFMIKGFFQHTDSSIEVYSSLQPGSKKIFRESGQDYQKIGDHIGKHPVVLISPDDTELIKEGGDSRRRFFDSIISQLDRQYLENLIQYNYVLKQRNSLLRIFHDSGSFDSIALETYDQMLITYGEHIYKRRSAFVTEFVPVFRKYYTYIVADEQIDLLYQSGLETKPFSIGLKDSLSKDRVLLRTNFGIHKDDYNFRLGEGDLKRLGSQGQQKSFVIALKLAQQEVIGTYKGFKPILLLDDIFDKLDDFRIARLMELIHEDQGQIFITDARPDRTNALLKGIGVSASLFEVEEGTLKPYEKKE
jgi:DNA replication and repair protein RecF